jgi:entericidin B
MKRNIILGFIMLMVVVSRASGVAGCNTVAGAGQDVSAGGEAIHDSARDVQKKM